jgi:DNA-binding beta-propeller fold protein YncE
MKTQNVTHQTDKPNLQRKNRLMKHSNTLLSRLGLCGLALLFHANVTPAAVSISPDVEYFYSDGPGEGLSVSPNGKFIMVSSPVPTDEAGTLFSSTVPHIVHTPLAPHPFNLVHTFALTGYGESTDVGVMPSGQFGLTVIRSDPANPFNGMLAIRGDRVVQEIAIPERPDGMKISPDGKYAIVAVEKGGEIRIYDLEGGAGQIRLAAIVTKAALEAWYVNVPNPTNAIEPEAVGISSDSSFAIVTIQDSSSVASVSLDAVTLGQQQGMSPEAIGDIALRKVLHLPFGFKGNNGALFGVEPDGVGISPDGSFAILAHEANNRAKHLQGFSVVDLRNGLENITAQTYSIFDIDPTLLVNTGLASVPAVAPGAPYPTAANRLPRLDPASVEIVNRGGQTVAALIVERYDPSAAQLAASPNNETRGSVLFLDAGQALNGTITKIGDRVPVGVSGSHVEVVDSAQGGRWIFVSISNGGADRGTFARFELLSQ